MINFYYEYELETLAEEQMRLWLHAVITAEGCSEGELNFIFCDDKYLLRQEELRRVMVHGILHLCGYKDKTKEESMIMRNKEDEKLKLFHVEH